MKFACLVEIDAAPTRRPLPPASSISRAAWSPCGFLNTLPQFGSASGCVRRRQSRASSIRARISAGSPPPRRTVAPTTTPSGARAERRYENPASLAGTRRLDPSDKLNVSTLSITSASDPP